MKITRAVVPSLFTVLNMFCGFFSIIHSSKENFEVAAWLIILGAIFDSLDGIMARITKSSSKFGVEFDSLSDLITFGAAPSFMAYKIYLHNLEGLGIIISSLPLILGGIRLARFNVQLVGFDKDYFKGLPIPAQAIALVAFVITYFSEADGIAGWKADVFIGLIIWLSLLMVSTFKYDTLPKFNNRYIKEHPFKFGIFLTVAVIIIVTKGAVIFPFFVLFSFSGIIRWIILTLPKLFRNTEKIVEEDSEKTSIDV